MSAPDETKDGRRHKRSGWRTAPPPQKGNPNFKRLWRVVDGAVADAFKMHPEYINPERAEWRVRSSINKRVVGAILGFAAQAAEGPKKD